MIVFVVWQAWQLIAAGVELNTLHRISLFFCCDLWHADHKATFDRAHNGDGV